VTNRKPLAAAYARYSTDKQSDTSIEDQVRVCRAQATRMQLEIGEVFSDSAVSGGVAPMAITRPKPAGIKAGPLTHQ